MSQTEKAQIDPTVPARLFPVRIPKPWGQEIWYTGMEARGESQIDTAAGPINLSQFLNADPDQTCTSTPVLLLKILDPRREPVYGDLYFEVHKEKREVYIVTHIDEAAWPDGRGAIRFGMNQSMRRRFSDDAAFRHAYRSAVAAYETIRRDIDEQGAQRNRDELEARTHMESFTALMPLSVGDVVRVPTWTPHALQHGVRVVEFQTQTYERYIVSFAQAVQTQTHWDTAIAVDAMHLGPPSPPQFESVAPGIERIARFEDFNVWRIDCALADEITLPDTLPYAVCMALTAQVQVADLALQHEQACFVPAAAIASTRIRGEAPALLLVAAPGL